jgi:hypothetical protein
MSVFLYSCLSYPARKLHIFCPVLYYHLWPVGLPYFSTLYHKRHDFRGGGVEEMV